MSDSDSDSGSSYESSSEEEKIIQKPLFISKKAKAKEANNKDVLKSHEIALQKLDHNLQLNENALDDHGDFDGTVDTDDIDVEREFKAWEERQLNRKREERERIKLEEEEKNDRIRQNDNPTREINSSSSSSNNNNSNNNNIQAKIGAFYSTDKDMDKFLKREYSKVEDLGDHSRPTRFKK